MPTLKTWNNWINEYIELVEKTHNNEASLSPIDANRFNYLRNLIHAGLGTKLTLAEDNRRLELRIPVRIDVILKAGDKEWKGHTVNVSVWGMFVTMDDPPPVGERVGVEIKTEEGMKILPGEVRWSSSKPIGNIPSGAGIRIDPISSNTHSIFRDFCHQKLKERIYSQLV